MRLAPLLVSVVLVAALVAVALAGEGPGEEATGPAAVPGAGPGEGAGSTLPQVAAGQLDGPIQLDGVLDEPAWMAAGVIPDLVQQSPHPLQATPYRTEVRVLVDEGNLYLGINCFDPDPSRAAIHTMQRDGDMEGDDTLTVVLDTFGDRRTGYLFRINLAAAREDALISGPGEASFDWDGVWDARVRSAGSGWTAEIVIPAQTLRFKSGLERWGFNVERDVARDRTVLRWAGTTLDSRLTDLSRIGELAAPGMKQGRGISFIPYGLTRHDGRIGSGEGTTKGEAGFDLAYSFTPELAGVLTVNTDFAETEVDTRQINLTRFPLFFPEKRVFFLEGSNQYGFARGLDTDFIPFYSRRIGLFNGQQVPIDAGVKVIGRAGAWGIGALDVRTGSSRAAPATNLFAGRMTYDAGDHLRLGTTVTRGDPSGEGNNSLVGADAVWQTSSFRGDKNLYAWVWGARSGGKAEPEAEEAGQAAAGPRAISRGEPGERTGWGAGVDYPNDLWDIYATVDEFGDVLNPALGFLPRPGTRKYEAGGAFQPRPSGGAFSWVRQFYFENEYTLVEDLAGKTESWRVFFAPFNVETQSGEHLEANWKPQFEFLAEPFEIAERVVIPVGSYHFDRFRLEAQSSTHRPWRIGSTVWFGDFYNGRLTQSEQFASWTGLSGRLQLTIDLENDMAHLRAARAAACEGDGTVQPPPFGACPETELRHVVFTERLWQLQTVLAFTPNLILSSYFQYEYGSPDRHSRDLGMNTRLRWTIRPGEDLFLVWNRGWHNAPLASSAAELAPVSDQILMKVRWTFRK